MSLTQAPSLLMTLHCTQIVIMVPAGKPVDSIVEQLLLHLQDDDVIMILNTMEQTPLRIHNQAVTHQALISVSCLLSPSSLLF
jgi:6-phosphogluconate dehydrogenase